MPADAGCAATVAAVAVAAVLCGAAALDWLFFSDSYAILIASVARGGPLSTELFGTQMVAGASRVIV
jgi:hypothetical protein